MTDQRLRAVHMAICNPGEITDRQPMPGPHAPWESRSHWEARAVLAVITPWIADEPAQVGPIRGLVKAWRDEAATLGRAAGKHLTYCARQLEAALGKEVSGG